MSDGGKVYIQPRKTGEVTVHKGLLHKKDARKLQAEETGETAPNDRPELTKTMQNYLDSHRHAAVRAELLQHAGVALRVALAQMIAGSPLWTVQRDPQKCATEAIAESLAHNKGQALMAEKCTTICALLGLEEEEASLVYGKEDWGKAHDVMAIFNKLMALSDEDVQVILTYVVAETLSCGSALMEALG